MILALVFPGESFQDTFHLLAFPFRPGYWEYNLGRVFRKSLFKLFTGGNSYYQELVFPVGNLISVVKGSSSGEFLAALLKILRLCSHPFDISKYVDSFNGLSFPLPPEVFNVTFFSMLSVE